MKVSLDTNCVLRWLLQDIPVQANKVEAVLHQTSSNIFIPDLVIIELAWVLKSVYDYNDKQVAELVRLVIDNSKFNCNRQLFEFVFLELEQSPKVLITDICLAFYAYDKQSTLLTFDKTLAKKLPKLTKLL